MFCGECGSPIGHGGEASCSSCNALPSDVPPADAMASRPPRRDPARLIGSIDRSWSARLTRGVALVRVSLELMQQQPGLLAVPVASTGAVVVLFALASVATGGSLTGAEGLALLVWLVAFGAMAAVATVGQAVITQRIMCHLNGERLSNSESLRAVTPRLSTLATWGCLNLAVGTFVRAIERGRGILGLVGRMVALIAVIAWSAATFFVVPVILFEGLGVSDAMRRSRELVRSTWGEGVVGVGALVLLFNLIGLGIVIAAVLLAAAQLYVLAMIFILLAIIAINLLSAVASPVFTVALYCFATTGAVPLGLSEQDLSAAFRPRRKRMALQD